jgi:O-antigen ligase
VIATAGRVLAIAGIAWGAFAFGAVYPWGYTPLALAAVALGLLGLFPRRGAGRVPSWFLPAALTSFVLAAALQLVPLPRSLVTRVSPEAPSIQVQYDPGARLTSSYPLSIAPQNTARGLALVASFGLLAMGASRLLALSGTTRLCGGIAVIGTLLAITGIVQKALYNGKILGFWTLLHGGSPFGPFVNRSHYAGWMLMAVPVSLGLLCATISRQAPPQTLRERVLWFSSTGASHVMLLGAGVGVMVLSILLSMSRSGILVAVGVVGLTAVLAWRRYPGALRFVVAGALVVLLFAVAGWAGVDQIMRRFSQSGVADINGRLGPWGDALRIAARYPIAGTGFNTYSVATLFYQQFNLDAYYSAAHNDYLQVLAEGGVLLTVPLIACLTALVVTIRRRFREETSRSTYWIRAGATIGLIAIGLQEIVDFSLQIPGNAFLFAVVCAIAIHRTPERQRA